MFLCHECFNKPAVTFACLQRTSGFWVLRWGLNKIANHVHSDILVVLSGQPPILLFSYYKSALIMPFPSTEPTCLVPYYLSADLLQLRPSSSCPGCQLIPAADPDCSYMTCFQFCNITLLMLVKVTQKYHLPTLRHLINSALHHVPFESRAQLDSTHNPWRYKYMHQNFSLYWQSS